MANGRFLSKSISTSEQLASVSLEADYLFTRCIPHLDVEGRLLGSARWIKSQIVPMRDEITVERIPQLLEELAAATDHVGRPLVVCYEVGGRVFLAFPGFQAHQQGLRANREAASKLPPPPTRDDGTPAQLPESSRSAPGVGPEDSRLSGREGKVSQAEAVRAREAVVPMPDESPQPAASAPLSLRDMFMLRYYGRATERRVADVRRQLDEALSPSGCSVNKHERAFATPDTLDKAIRETLADGAVRDGDRAIVILLRKLVSGRCNETRPPGLMPSEPRTPARGGGGGCASLGSIVGSIAPPRAPVPAAASTPVITPEMRAEAMAWIAERPRDLAALEANADAEAAAVHPNWETLPKFAAVRARNLEESIVAAYRAWQETGAPDVVSADVQEDEMEAAHA